MQDKISIAECLAKIHTGETVSLVYVRSSRGKLQGTLKYIHQAVSGWNYDQFTPRERTEYMKNNSTGLHKENGTLPMIDLEENQQLTLKISHIIGFNNKKVIH